MSSYNPFSIENKTILITGASSGIGHATAVEASKMGATCVLIGRDETRLRKTLNELSGTGHKIIQFDLTDVNKLKHFVGELPPVDGAVLCAGKGYTKPVRFSDPESFQEVFQINFFSQGELVRQLYNQKKLQQNTSVVFVSSIGGTTSFNFGNGIYGSSKAALTSYMKFCAREFAPKGIRVNCVSPGMTETPLIHRGQIGNEQLDLYRERYPLKRFGKPQEIAWGIIYLLSDASSFITGSNLFIDGGW